MKFIDPLTDFSFKRLFGIEPNKDLLIDFLNAVFQGKKVIVDLVYNNNEAVGDTEAVGSVIFDLRCRAADGSIFLIEVQRTDQHNLKRRMLYYASKLIVDQAPKGKRSAWNYGISEVYVVVLIDGFSMPDGKGTNYLHHVSLFCEETAEQFYDGLLFVYLEIVNFVKKEADLQDDLDKWLYVLKNMSSMQKLPLFLRKSIFNKLFQLAEYSKMTKEECIMYDQSLKRKWDAYNIEETARLRGVEQGEVLGIEKGEVLGIEKGKVLGIEEGKVLGIEEGKVLGIEEGKVLGIEEGKEDERRALASKLKARDFSHTLIAEITGLSLKDIEQI